jgi:hypothetical protein
VAAGSNSASPSQPVRSTQSFVGTLSECWSHPSLIGLEVLWRWLFGIPALWIAGTKLHEVLLAATGGTLDPATLGLDNALLNDPVGALTADPMGAAGKFARAVGLVLPGVEHIALWLAPALLLVWVVVSSLGRTVVLRRADPDLQARPATMMALQALRVAGLAACFLLWFRVMRWDSATAITGPIAAGNEPSLVLYCAVAIVSSIALFIAWGCVSWWFAVAPLLAMARGTGILQSLRAAARLKGLRGELVEINLVMGIVKIALLVLAMVFSACPLPFETVTTPGFLAWWWAGVALLYLLGSDFFHVARLVAYLTLLRASVRANKSLKASS